MSHFDISMLFTGYAWWLMLPLAALLAYAAVRLYRRETESCHNGKWLRALRAAVVVLMVLLLSQPVLHRVSATFQPPVVIVLRDISDSMHVKDSHEPLERRVRAAVIVGLLDSSRRDTHAEQAVQALLMATDAAEASATGMRQALQLLQESSTNLTVARDRVRDSTNALATFSKESQRAGSLLKSIKAVPPAITTGLQHALESSARLTSELGALALEKDGPARLLDKSRSVKALIADLSKLTAGTRQLQDLADRELGEKGGKEVKAALDKLNGMDRAALVSAMLDKKALAGADKRIQIISYDFDTDLRDVSSAQPATDTPEHSDTAEKDKKEKSLPSADSKSRKLPPPADTDLATPLLHLAERHAQQSIAAVVLCSDGRHTTGPNPEDAARVLSARGIVVHTLGVGSLDAPPDIAVARLDGTLSVFLDETIHLTAHIKMAGYKGKKCKLILSREDKVLQTRELTIVADGWLHESFELPAERSGPNVFNASIEPLPGEALTTNNSAEAVVDVANDRLKVLLVDELPRWETRYLGSLLRRDRKMTLDERWLLTAESMGLKAKVLPDEQKALDDYDVVILGDIHANRLSEESQKRLASYVADRGGFLVFIAGPEAMPRSYLSGPIADLLPVRMQAPSTSAVPSAEAQGPVRVKLDPAGLGTGIMRILRDPTLNEQLWSALPELHWIQRPAYAKPGASTLLSTDDARKDVAAAVHSFGAGRVLYVGTDETWRWRYKVADRIHSFFWSQAMRWGTSNRLTGDARLKAGTDRRQIRPGENVEVLARPRDANGHAVADAIVVAELDDKEHPQRVQLQAVPDSGGLYRGSMQNVGAGIRSIQVKVESAGFDGVKQDLQVIAHEISGQEGIELTRDASRLAAIAKAGSGRYLDILDAPELFEQLAGQGKQITVESSFDLWSSYPALLLIVGLLTSEWLMRKRAGLA